MGMIAAGNIDVAVAGGVEFMSDARFFSAKLLIFSYPSVLTNVWCAQKYRLIETVPLSTHSVMFWLRNKKISLLVHTLVFIPIHYSNGYDSSVKY